MFEFIGGWLFELTLYESFKRILNIIHGTDIIRNIRNEISKWVKRLPEDYFIDEDALFPGNEHYENLVKYPYLNKLKQKLHNKSVPPTEIWTEALSELWRFKKEKLGNKGQPFFQKDFNEILPYITQLSENLYKVCANNDSFFKITMIDSVIKNNVSNSQNNDLDELLNELSIIEKLLNDMVMVRNNHLNRLDTKMNKIVYIVDIKNFKIIKKLYLLLLNDITKYNNLPRNTGSMGIIKDFLNSSQIINKISSIVGLLKERRDKNYD